jgi:hypothetical protein
MIAIGAVLIMRQPHIFAVYLKHLTRLVASGKVGTLANPGNYGELIASIIFARALDAAVLKYKTVDNSSSDHVINMRPGDVADFTGENLYTEPIEEPIQVYKSLGAECPVTVDAWFDQLFSSAHTQRILNTVQSIAPLRELVTNGWLWPLQFVHCQRPILENDTILKDAWTRRFAIVTSHDQMGCDIIIPIMIAGDNYQTLTGLFVEVKCHEGAIGNSKLYNYICSVRATARKLVPTGAIACMVLQLGIGGIVGRSETPNTGIGAPPPADRVWVNKVMVPSDCIDLSILTDDQIQTLNNTTAKCRGKVLKQMLNVM